MRRIENILDNEKNIGLDFVVHVKNESELNDLIEVLIEREFCIQVSLDLYPNQLDVWMKRIAAEEGYDLCFRIRNRADDKCVAYNPSVEHWRLFCNDILEIIDGELEFNEGKYSLDDAKIDAKKLYEDMKEDASSLQMFDLSKNATDAEIMDKIVSLIGYSKEELF